MPRLAEAWNCSPPTRNGLAKRDEHPTGETSADSAVERPSNRSTNSSPPNRATVSPGRDRAAQPLADADEELVADIVTQSVVHELEPIEVEEHHRGAWRAPDRHPRSPARGGRGTAAGSADPSQRVVEGLVLERGLHPLALGEVSGVDDDARDRRSVEEVRDDRLDVAPVAVGVADSQLERRRGRHDTELGAELELQP